MAHKYNSPINNLSARIAKEQRLFKQLTNKDALADALISLYRNALKSQQSDESFKEETLNKFIQLYKPVYHEMNKSKLSLKDFEVLHKDTFAKGAFGKVTLVKSKHDKDSNNIYAMKISSKSKLRKQLDRSSPMEERLILASYNDDKNNENWLPHLHAAFQDEKNLYLVMEYAPGGDLQGLMERRSYQPFTEAEAKFYCAELILAIDQVHQLGYMHRDVKPGNILIDSKGHIKLGDLGSCISSDSKDYLLMVGTMPYVSPEMCDSEGMNASKGPAYGLEVDWWSMGVVLYEMLHGERPFTGNDVKIQMDLVNPKVSIQFKSHINLSEEAKDLLSRLLEKDKSKRLGCTGSAEIKSHPFFKDIDWKTLRTKATPPFVPSINSTDDIQYFSADNNSKANTGDDKQEDAAKEEVFDNDELDDILSNEYAFIGYTFSSSAQENKRTVLEKPAKSGSNQEFIAQYRQRLNNLDNNKWEDEKNKLNQLHEEEIKRLKDEHSEEIARLQTAFEEAESSLLEQKEEIEQSKETLITELQKKNEEIQKTLEKERKESSLFESTIKELQDKLAMNTNKKEQSQASTGRLHALQNQLKEMEVAHDDLKKTNKTLQQQIERLETERTDLRTKVDSLQNENDALKRDGNSKNKYAELQYALEQQIENLTALEKELQANNEKCIFYEEQIEEYQSYIEQLEQCKQQTSSSNAEEAEEEDNHRHFELEQLRQTNEVLQNELEEQKEQVEKLKEHFAQEQQEQSDYYSSKLKVAQAECTRLRQDLEELKKQLSDRGNVQERKMVAAAPSSEESLAKRTMEGKSILATMWKRDRDALRKLSQVLATSESNLTQARQEVSQLKREIVHLQKQMQTLESNSSQRKLKQHSLKTTSGISSSNGQRQPLNTVSADNKSNSEPVKSNYSNRTRKPLPTPIVTASSTDTSSVLSGQFHAQSRSPQRGTTTIAKPIADTSNNEVAQQSSDNHISKLALEQQIEKEELYIRSTEKTIAARARLGKPKSEFDQDLKNSLERAYNSLSYLKSQLKNKAYAPSDFLQDSHAVQP